MSLLRALAARVHDRLHRAEREREWQLELESNLALHVEDNLAAGMSLDEARRAARVKLGGVAPATEALRDLWSLGWLETAAKDLRYAARVLRRAPGFSVTAVLSLALGLGASLTLFTIADNLLLRPLPYRDPSRLVMVWEANMASGRSPRNVVSPANYFEWRAASPPFASMAAFHLRRAILTVGARSEELATQAATVDLLPTLGVKPWRGRWFTPEEDRPGGAPAVVISYRVWQDWFGGAADVVGRRVQMNATPRTVVGVLPPDFYLLDRDVDLWEPLALDRAEILKRRRGRSLLSLARLEPEMSVDAAQAQMAAIARRLAAAWPEHDKGWTVNVEPLREAMVGPVKPALRVLLGAVALLLLVACANVAGLLLARYAARRREISVRVALGAGRGRVVRQLLTESLLLGLAGGAAGLLLAKGLLAGLLALAPQELARGASIAVDGRIVLFGFGLAAATVLVFGLTPALLTTRTSLMAAGRQDDRSSLGGGHRLRAVLVGAEIALSVMLLAGALLLARSLAGLQGIDPGLDPRHLLTFRVTLPSARYAEPPPRTRFFAGVQEELERLPGVRAASAVSYLPFRGLAAGTGFAIEGRPPAPPGEEPTTTVRTVLPGYFRTMGIALLAGRDFTAADDEAQAPLVFVVNQAFAQRHFPGGSPLAARVSVEMQDDNPYGEIVGVVSDVKEGSLDQPPAPTVYYPHARLPYAGMVFVARTGGDPKTLAEPARRAVARLDPVQPIAEVRTMEEVLGDTLGRQRLSALLMVSFSAVSLLLAAVGLYGTLAYAVSQRVREIGVRVALGATPGRIVRWIADAGGRIALAGTVAGVAGALALTGLLRGLLFGIAPRDPLTFVLVPVTLALVALAAAALPARRAARLPAAEALRSD